MELMSPSFSHFDVVVEGTRIHHKEWHKIPICTYDQPTYQPLRLIGKAVTCPHTIVHLDRGQFGKRFNFLVFDDEQKNFNFVSVNNQCKAVLHTSELEHSGIYFQNGYVLVCIAQVSLYKLPLICLLKLCVYIINTFHVADR